MPSAVKASSRRDFFISHASEDKDAIARPLANELLRRGHSVWFDEYELVLGDSLRQMIDTGLADSRVGVVILSHHFFEKEWPQLELNGLHAKIEAGEKNAIVPIRHGLTPEDVRRYSPLLGSRLSGSSETGVTRLADEVEKALTRAEFPKPPRRNSRRSRSAGFSGDPTPPSASGEDRGRASTERRAASPRQQRKSSVASAKSSPLPEPQPTASAPTRITDLEPGIATKQRAEILAERIAVAIKEHPGDCLMTVTAGGGLLLELMKRTDGVVTIRSKWLRPPQRVLAAHAKTQLEVLTISVLRQLPGTQLGGVEILCTPEALSELPARMRASKAQVELVATLLATLKEGADRRRIGLREERGTVSLRRCGEAIELLVDAKILEAPRKLSLHIGDPELEEAVLAAVTDVSTRRGFGNTHLTDSFPLREVPSFSKLRMLAERLLAAGGRFTLWQRRPVKREVLIARVSKGGDFVLERPGSVPSVERFAVSEMVRLIEALEEAVEALVEAHDEPLQAHATWLITEPLP